MAESNDIALRDRFAALFAAAVEAVIAAIRAELSAGRQPRRKPKEPSITHQDNGLPRLSDSSYFEARGPLQYADLLERQADPARPFYTPKFEAGRFAEVDALVDFVRANPGVSPHYPSDVALADGAVFDMTRIHIELQLAHAANRFFLRFGEATFDDRRRIALLAPFFRGLFNERLDVAIVVPIAMVKFSADRQRLAKDAYLIRMNEALQKMRWEYKAYGASGHDSVLAAATHAFVLTGWHWPNLPWLQLAHNLAAPIPALRERIDELFAALRLSTGVETGYAQELRVARRWTHLMRDLPPEGHAAGARRYPDAFDNFAWAQDNISLVDRKGLRDTARVLGQLRTIGDERLSLALRRLNGAMIRSEDADAILDATIALEILLSDGEPQAIGYKLQMRAGALAKIDGRQSSGAAAAAMKKLYEARSSIVHGVRRKRGAKSKAGEGRAAAIDLLREVLLTLLRHPRYLDPRRIDTELLLGDAARE